MAGNIQPRLSLAQSAWIIVLVPALVGIIFAIGLGKLSLDIEKTVRERASVAYKVNIINQLMELLAGQMEAYIDWHTQSEAKQKRLDELSEGVIQQLHKLKALAADDPELLSITNSGLKIANQLAKENHQEMKSKRAAKKLAQRVISLHTPMQRALNRLYERITASTEVETEQREKMAVVTIVTGILLSSAVSGVMFALFSRRVAKRLNILKENAADLAAGIEVGAKLSGNDELNKVEDELVSLSQELHVARQRKQEFLSMIGHDLRSPLTSLQMTLEMYANGVYGELDEVLQHDVDKHLSDMKQLVVFISDLLDLEKLEAGSLELNLEPLKISTLFNNVRENLPAGLGQNPDNFEVIDWERPIQTFGDPDRLEIALNRVVMSCLLDTPGPVRMRASDIPEQSKILITVETRPGQNRLFSEGVIFDRFEVNVGKQILFKSFRHSLALARELIRMQGGDIDVSHQPNSVRFNISLKRWREGMQ